MTDCTVTELPQDEAECIMRLLEESLKEGPTGVSGRFMKDFGRPMLKMIEEELQRDDVDCVIGLVSFFSCITSNLVANTSLFYDSDKSCDMFKKLFCDLVDQTKLGLRELKRTRS